MLKQKNYGQKNWAIITIWILCFLLLLISVLKLIPAQALPYSRIPLLLDPYDLEVYFHEARWIHHGSLYIDVFSEYLLLPNLYFALLRFLANDDFGKFTIIWGVFNFCLMLASMLFVFKKISSSSKILFLTPGLLYFSLWRFDLFLYALTLLALYFFYKKMFTQGTILFGIGIAFKGYLLFGIPVLAYWILKNKGIKHSIFLSLICLAPFMISSLVVISYAGFDGFLAPFLFHAKRGPNGESIYDVVSFLFNFNITNKEIISRVVPLIFSFAPLFFIRRSFESLVDSLAIVVLGFVTFSQFYSPQFCLWILPFVLYRPSKWTIVVTVIFLWATYFEFPLMYFVKLLDPLSTSFFDWSVVTVTFCRILLIFSFLRPCFQEKAQIESCVK